MNALKSKLHETDKRNCWTQRLNLKQVEIEGKYEIIFAQGRRERCIAAYLSGAIMLMYDKN